MLKNPKNIKKKMPPATKVPVTVDYVGDCNFCGHKMVEDRHHSAEEMYAICDTLGHYTKCVGKIGMMMMCEDCCRDLDKLLTLCNKWHARDGEWR